jgi:hypothetical protein
MRVKAARLLQIIVLKKLKPAITSGGSSNSILLYHVRRSPTRTPGLPKITQVSVLSR